MSDLDIDLAIRVKQLGGVRAVAKQLGLSAGFITNVLKGKRKPPEALALLLGNSTVGVSRPKRVAKHSGNVGNVAKADMETPGEMATVNEKQSGNVLPSAVGVDTEVLLETITKQKAAHRLEQRIEALEERVEVLELTKEQASTGTRGGQRGGARPGPKQEQPGRAPAAYGTCGEHCGKLHEHVR